MSGNAAMVREKSGKKAQSRERSGNLCSQRNLTVAAQQNNLPVLYLYCNSFFICDVHGVFGLINVYLFNILPEILSGKVRDFFLSGDLKAKQSIDIHDTPVPDF